MTSKSAKSAGATYSNPAYRVQAGTGRFMLTLCPLAAPVSIRPPQSPQLKPFTFFMSRLCHPDGSERLYLNMGYFDTLVDAERWAESVRRHYPTAFATVAPAALLRPLQAESSAAAPFRSHSVGPQGSGSAPTGRASLTDTQVLKVLEARRASVHDQGDESNCEQIALLRPEDTGVRLALKEAVTQGRPVSFAVQLQWSTQPIDLSRVRPLAIFKAYTVYATENRRKGHSSYFLRLGFFADPISAKQVAVQVRWTFPSAAVVPVLDSEVARASEPGRNTSAIAYLDEPPVNRQFEAGDTPEASAQSNPPADAPRRTSKAAKTVTPRQQQPAKQEMWDEADPLSESGVRHLRVEVQEHMSGRWKIVKLGDMPAGMEQVYS